MKLYVDDAYASNRDTLETCLANVVVDKDHAFTIGSLTLVLERIDVSVETPGGFEAASFAKLFDALSSCREKHESGAHGDGRKK